jgi:hypothetical protein
VDRVLKLLAIDKQGHLFSIDVLRQRGVTVAGEAVFVFELMLGANGERRAQQKERERTEQDSAGNFHGYEETLDALRSP